MTTGRLAPLVGLLSLTASTTVLAINAPQPDAPPPIRATPPAQRILSSNWENLLPLSERDHFSLIPPPPLHDYLSQTAVASQSGSAQVNRALEGTTIQLTGFIVPLDLGPSGSIIEFFLVPYVGACIHVSPPAPNQMVYVHMDKSLPLRPLYEPYTVTGRLHAHSRGSDLGSAAYSMDVGHIEHYGS